MSDDPPLKLPKDTFKTFFRANLGTFIDLYAIVENALRDTLQHVAGVDNATALAIFSGVKSNRAMSFIRRLYQARGQQIPAELDRVLQQFAVITNLRNDILHHRVDFENEPPVTSNRATVLNENAVRETEIRPETLARAGEDLGLVLLVLMAIRTPDRQQSADDLAWSMREAWKYKPTWPRRKDQPASKTHPAPKPPPRSSRG